ncbi:MAG: ABC transporter substrate-binding protein [Ruminococcaceae bacterium]|nr:ABC transporter substrate-binding protein [Oscillospiraceae bacterium]
MKKALSLFISLCVILSLFSCGTNTGNKLNNGEYIEITDALGRSVLLPKYPERTAVLFSSLADIWVTAGGTVDITVGESVERGFCSADAALVDKGAGKTIDAEALIASSPDLVIFSSDIKAQADAAAICEKADIPTAAFRVESFSDYLYALRIFTELTGKAEAYEKHGAEQKERIDNTLSKFKENNRSRKILFIRASSSAAHTKAKKAEDHFACAMLEELGCKNIADSAPVLLDGLSFEEILIQDPDIIFVSVMGDENSGKSYIDSLFSGKEWKSISAVRDGNVVFLPKDLFQYKPNSRWYEAYNYLISILS